MAQEPSNDSPAGEPPPLGERLAQALENVSDVYVALDRHWQLVIFNRAAEAYYGYSRDLVLGRKIWEVLPQGLGSPIEAAFRKAMDEGAATVLEMPSMARPGHYVELHIAPLRDIGVAMALNDVTARREADEHMRLMVNELNHRVKNTMAIVQGLARQTFTTSRTLEQARADFSARLLALSAAHDVITEQNWEGADLGELIRRTLAGQLHASNRVVLSGPSVRIPAKTAISLGLALHELATNAVKHGSLSNETGKVELDWTASGAVGAVRLHLTWTESGGPTVAPPSRRGFGSRLLERALAADLGGKVDLRYEPAGLVCQIEAPLVQ